MPSSIFHGDRELCFFDVSSFPSHFSFFSLLLWKAKLFGSTWKQVGSLVTALCVWSRCCLPGVQPPGAPGDVGLSRALPAYPKSRGTPSIVSNSQVGLWLIGTYLVKSWHLEFDTVAFTLSTPFILIAFTTFLSIWGSNITYSFYIFCLPPFKQICVCFIRVSCFAVSLPFEVPLSQAFHPPQIGPCLVSSFYLQQIWTSQVQEPNLTDKDPVLQGERGCLVESGWELKVTITFYACY